MAPQTTTGDTTPIPVPEEGACRLFGRLSRASVAHSWDAYRDVDWDAAEHQISVDDPAWEATGEWDPLAASPWYRGEPAGVRSAIGLRRIVELLATGIAAEAVLGEGLVRYAATLPNRHPAFRYAYHEIAEEAQHSLMFQEFIQRSGIEPAGPDPQTRARFDRFAAFGDSSPVLFFVAALATEEAFDHVQRLMLHEPSTHPLIRRIFRIHVTEEARHLSFARAVLRDIVPRYLSMLDGQQVRELRLQVPFVINWTATHMVSHTDSFFDACGTPPDACYSISDGPLARELRRQGSARVTGLCRELGLIDPRLDTLDRATDRDRPVAVSGPTMEGVG